MLFIYFSTKKITRAYLSEPSDLPGCPANLLSFAMILSIGIYFRAKSIQTFTICCNLAWKIGWPVGLCAFSSAGMGNNISW